MPKHKPITVTPSLIKRFWDHLPHRPVNGCWHWNGQVVDYYGVIWAGSPNTHKQFMPHRVSWVIHNGPIPDGMQVCHHCDNKSCARPDHLYVCDQQQNTRDMVDRNRRDNSKRKHPDQYGERNAQAKLTRDQVREIRRRHAAGGITGKDLAVEYGITTSHACGIIRRRFWAWLSDEAA